jgi:hypothetical protein
LAVRASSDAAKIYRLPRARKSRKARKRKHGIFER